MDAVVPGVWQGQGQPVLVWMFIAVVPGSGRDRANQSVLWCRSLARTGPTSPSMDAVVSGVWQGQGQPVLVWMLWCQASGRDRANQS